MSNIVPVVSSFPTTQEFQTMKEMGTMAVKSGFLPTSINSPEKAIIIMMKGRELGIPPMQAFSSIAVINGKPTMTAELMLSMIYKNIPGVIVNFLTTDAETCVIEAKRPRGKATKFSFTMADAARAGLSGKGPWVSYPAAMLRARCVSAMARAMFPDALSGVVYTPEELGAEIDGEGNVIEIPAEEATAGPEVAVVEPAQAAINQEPDVWETRVPSHWKIKPAGKTFRDLGVDGVSNLVKDLRGWSNLGAGPKDILHKAELALRTLQKRGEEPNFEAEFDDASSAYQDAKAAGK